MLLIKIREIGATPWLMKRELPQILKRVWEEIGNHWHRQMRPKHFTHAGAREYGYTPRKGEKDAASSKGFRRSYSGRKLRKFGHTLPLVYTGESRDITARRDVRPTRHGVRIVMAANKLNYKNPYTAIDKRDEMTRVSPEDTRTLAAMFNRWLNQSLRAMKVSREISI